jgi:hypothetical protein
MHDLPVKLNKLNRTMGAMFLVQKIIPYQQKVVQKSPISKTSLSHVSFRQKNQVMLCFAHYQVCGRGCRVLTFESSNLCLPFFSSFRPFAYKIVMRITRNERAPALESFVLSSSLPKSTREEIEDINGS